MKFLKYVQIMIPCILSRHTLSLSKSFCELDYKIYYTADGSPS